jgi:hypothetical protein
MSAPLPESAVHPLAADGFVGRGIGGTDVALCGALVPASSLPPSCCPPDCDCALYCPECVRVVACWHTDAGQAARAVRGPRQVCPNCVGGTR